MIACSNSPDYPQHLSKGLTESDTLILQKSGEEKTLHLILRSKVVEGQLNRTRSITPKIGPKGSGKNGFESPFPASIAIGEGIAPNLLDIAVEQGNAPRVSVRPILKSNEKVLEASIVFGLRILAKENFDFKHLGRFLSAASFPCNDATIALFCRQASAHEEHSFQKKDGVIWSYDLAQDHFFQ